MADPNVALRAESALSTFLFEFGETLWEDDERTIRAALAIIRPLTSKARR